MDQGIDVAEEEEDDIEEEPSVEPCRVCDKTDNKELVSAFYQYRSQFKQYFR